uniref:Zinc finger protein 654 n=1 Tax=Electrophorus electricus TaxID=8005 RepID=A0A4W4FT96_ELEEL
VLRSALCTFVHGATSFPSDCEHVRYTLSSIALSVFELLLFFGKDEFPEDPLKEILDSFQECHSSLVRYQNVYLLQVRQIIRDGGPWASPVLQGILKESEQAQEEVERYLSSELSIFFELRVRYLLACEQTREAMVLAQRCSQHLTAGRHLFFKQAYLTCLCKASDLPVLMFGLDVKMAEIDGKDAVEILCMVEKEEKEELLLGLSRSFLLQQLMSGDMCYLWHLVFIWCKLYLRMNTPREEFLEECKQMILSATNIKAIFPFIKVILAELEQDGLTFCLELCARALQTDLKNEPVTKSLIYKIIAYLLPNDLEVCRACALLVFFLERTVEAYKTVFLLYNHPDQEYHLDTSPIGNHVRFELIQILKKGLYFDPEFWSLLNIRTNCLKLMSEKVAKAALCEIMEEDNEHKIPASLAEEKPQEPEEDQNELPWDMRAVTNSSAPVSGSQTVVRLLHCCGLCGKECKSSSVLRHAFWHYRIERKCMFCHCFNYAHGPLCHFKKHIKDLKEGLTTLSEKPDQIVPRALPKKMRPGLAQIKSRLLMKLNVRRETSPQHKVENNLDANGRSLKQNFKKIGATGELEEGKEMEEKNEDDQGRIPKTKVRYFTRGLVRKSESKGKFLRARLARKAKTEGDVSGTQDSNVHRANGVLRKRRNMKHKCLFCGRRIWSPQHFFDHVVSHRGNLKHPCYHVDCKERFKTRLALGDHMLKDHHPLRAVCCFPGCAGQFANSKLLYSHERVHYKLVRKKALPKKNKSVTSSFKKCEKVVEMNLTASNANPSEMQQTLEGITAAPSQTQPAEGAQQTKSATPVKLEDEKPLMLNRSSVSYANKSPRLVNGHSKHGREARVKPPAAVASKEQLMEYGKMSNKPFVRPPPSAYLDESYISMPKRWKGPQLSPKGSTVSIVSPTKRQCCSRCSASFDTDEELQAHREKCTSLFGFDSDDESECVGLSDE